MTIVEAPDAIAGLPRLSWRGVTFPYSSVTTTYAHDKAKHKMPMRPGAWNEPTGRGERVVSVVASFSNGVVWEPTKYTVPWFPDVFRAFEAAFATATIGDLVHPLLGTMRATPGSITIKLAAEKRGGVDVDCTFDEHTDDKTSPLSKTSALSMAIGSAADLDSNLTALRIKADAKQKAALDAAAFSFTDAVRSIQAITDTVALIEAKALSQITRIQYQVTKTVAVLDSFASAQVASCREACTRLMASLYGVQQSVKVTEAQTSLYVVPVDTTMSRLSSKLANTITQLVTLNPTSARSPRVPQGALIRYYQQ